MDDSSSPLLVEDGRASDLLNVVIDDSGKLEKRHGYNKVGDRLPGAYSASDQFPAVTGLFSAKSFAGTDYTLNVCNNRVYKYASSAWSDITGSSSITYNKNNQFSFVSGLNNIIFTNDTDLILKWPFAGNVGTLAVTGLSTPVTKAKCLAWYREYLILANLVEDGTESPVRWRWSSVGTIESFDDDNYLDIPSALGQEIEAVGVIGDNLFLFLTDNIWKVYYVGGTNIFQQERVISTIGCIAKNSVQSVNFLNQRQGVLFLSRDKRVYFFDGSSILDVSIRISELMSGLNKDRLKYAVSSVKGDHYYLAVTNGDSYSENNLLLDFDYITGEWSKHDNVNANAMSYVIDSSSLPEVYFGNYDSFVYDIDDPDLYSDVDGATGGVSSVITNFNLPDATGTGLTMLVTDNPITFNATGAIVSIVSGAGAGEQKTIVYHTNTGVVVDSAFSVSPTGASLFSVGEIDSYYSTKWFDLGDPSRRKLIGQMYLWGKEEGNVEIDVSESLDFASVINNESVDLTGSGALWGVSLWGVGLWGGQDAMMKVVKMQGEGRFVRAKFSNDEIDEGYSLYNYSWLFWPQDYQ